MLNLLKQARTALTHLSPEKIRHHAHQAVHIGLVASTSAGFAAMEDFLIPGGVARENRLQCMAYVHRAGDPGAPEDVDLVVYFEGIQGPPGTYVFHPADPEATVREILGGNDDIALPLARQFPAFRAPFVQKTIQSIARENALFAIATALPDVVPNLMEMPWAFGEWASDTAFLTANQIRMAFLIAAACDRDLGFSEQKLEILSIGGGAFGWRALARELVGKIPLGGGLIPKGAIAYAGTFVIGKGLERLYHANSPFTKNDRKQVYRAALEQGKAELRQLAP